jgi:anti-sigma factor RsiW
MSRGLQPEQKVVSYLLGKLTPEECLDLEERLFTDDELNEELAASADDLIHAYLDGQLSAEDRARFEAHFLASPRRRERVVFVRDLLTAIGRVAAEAPPVPARTRRHPWELAAAAALVAAALIASLQRRPAKNDAQVASASPAPAVTPTAAPLPEPTASPREAPHKASPGTRPSGPATVRAVRLPPAPTSQPVDVDVSKTALVRLEVPVDSDGPPSYDAVLRRADAGEVWRAEGIVPPAPGEPMVIEVPARVLSGGDYQLSLEPELLRDARRPAWPTLRFALRVRQHH